jgi:septal ring factor EnvC (AmiA/AmiB activator)
VNLKKIQHMNMLITKWKYWKIHRRSKFKEENFCFKNKNKFRSTSQTDTKTKELQEIIADIKDNTNNTVESLKKTEDDLSNLNIIIHKMRAQLIEKITSKIFDYLIIHQRDLFSI